mgnify:CR=1 FL=1
MVSARPPRSRLSRHVEVDGWVFLTGQMPTDPNDDKAALPAGIEAQTRRVMDNLVLVLEGIGLQLEHVVAARAFLTHFERDYAPMNDVYRSYFAARTASRRGRASASPGSRATPWSRSTWSREDRAGRWILQAGLDICCSRHIYCLA